MGSTRAEVERTVYVVSLLRGTLLNGTRRVASEAPSVVPDDVLGWRTLSDPSPAEVAQQVSAPGSHGIVQVPSSSQQSHMLTVLNDGGEIKYIDPQAGGTVVPAPDEIWGFWTG